MRNFGHPQAAVSTPSSIGLLTAWTAHDRLSATLPSRMVCFAGKQFHFVFAVPNSVRRRTRTPHKPASDDVAVPSPLETIPRILRLAQHGLSSSTSIVGRNETKHASKHPIDKKATRCSPGILRRCDLPSTMACCLIAPKLSRVQLRVRGLRVRALLSPTDLLETLHPAAECGQGGKPENANQVNGLLGLACRLPSSPRHACGSH
ncbi:hypothetical protein QBC34DRAFT_414754 [Podospora aff. communis PSN243]|uniref:Uncharacterized protein n=1 Tax=Podospora aff. communis PSN243 TaxID=3040156 RepID=A0AAV9G968_9PEZI|nr:hypothetical protein QBC34DRAFT_414754 [Podospora aff. communis PSN243]